MAIITDDTLFSDIIEKAFRQEYVPWKPTEVENDEIIVLKNTVRILFGMSAGIHAPKNKVVIAGGVFTSLVHKEHPKDIDVFFLDGALSALFEYENFHKRNLKDEKSYIRENKMITEIYSENNNFQKFQYIFTKYKSRKELLDHFDLVHTKISFYEDKLYMSQNSFNAAKNKLLIPANPMKKPAQWRIEKFRQRGFTGM